MIKKLILVRHSKAEDRSISVNDFERSLTLPGKADTKRMAEFLRMRGTIPEIILSSSSARAFETAMIMADTFGTEEKNIIATRKLYYCSAKTILDQVYGLPENLNCVMVVAHNPGISDLARALSSGRSFFMNNTQVLIMDYDAEHWYGIDTKKATKSEVFSLNEIK